MIAALTASEMRALDELAIREIGVPGVVLMETAGRGVVERLLHTFAYTVGRGHTAVLCGKGNNGGDGFVVARCLANRGLSVTAFLLGSRGDVRGDAAVHLGAYLGGGGRLVEVGEDSRSAAASEVGISDLIVDAVLGTGLVAEVGGLAAEAIQWISNSDKPVVSVDIPSGISSDTGQVCGSAVTADLTVTFGWPKRGHFLFPGASHAGRVEVVDIGIPPSALNRMTPGLYGLEGADFSAKLQRPREAHKGTFGHVWVFGGGGGKEGAALLASAAALRSGAGLATLAWPAGVWRRSCARVPLEVMCQPLPDALSEQGDWSEDLWRAATDFMERVDAVVIGPGLGTSEGAASFLNAVLEGERTPPLVLDADALTLLARRRKPWNAGGREAVLTPHPGEAARLLETSAATVQGDRVGAARALADRHGCPVVLKGAATLVAAPGSPVFVVREGNPGMATAGAGDVLAGVVGALLARGWKTLEAAGAAAFVHAGAGDLCAARIGQDGLTATDLLGALPTAFRDLAEKPPSGSTSIPMGREL